jgi:chromosome segregation protein
VVRYAEYLHRLDKTQFIVITHRRGTMEQADVLFGVTMQEKGVSRVIELDLAEAQKTAQS